jgi:hypothetical protein
MKLALTKAVVHGETRRSGGGARVGRRPRHGLVAVLLASLVSGALVRAPASRAAEPPRFRESLWAREASVVVAEPPSRGDRLEARNWLVVEDGIAAEVVRVEAAVDADGEPWRTLVWVDPRLAGPGNAVLATQLMAASQELFALGTIEVAGPGLEWAASRDARRWQAFLEDLLVRPAPERLPVRHDEMAAALDALVLQLAERGAVDAGVLVLPAAALPLAPAAWNALRSGSTAAPTGEGEIVEALLDAARVAAAYGWIPIVLVPQRPRIQGDSVGPGSRGAPMSPPGLYSTTSQAPSAGVVSASLQRTLDAILDPSLQAWRRFTALGDGGVVRSGEALGELVASVPARFRIWYRTALPPDGGTSEAEVRWLRNGAMVRAEIPRRRGIPVGVARARLRYLMRYGADRLGDLPLSPSVPDSDSPTGSVSVRLGPLSVATDPPPPAWVRVSCARAASAQEPAAWSVALVERTRHAQSFSAPVACAAGRIGVLIEDLESERWGSLAIGAPR